VRLSRVASVGHDPNFAAPGEHHFFIWNDTVVRKDYQRFATRCLEEACIAVDARQKALLQEMAQAWQRLADEAKSAKGLQEASTVSEPDRGD
jgi:hypothetical protein